MLNYEQFNNLNVMLKKTILEDTFKEIETGVPQNHSLSTIALQDRRLAIGCRMIGSGSVLIGGTPLNGKQIADIFLTTAITEGFAYYPLMTNRTAQAAEQLVLFVKDNNTNKYRPYVRFKIVCDPIKTSTPPAGYNNASVLNALAAFPYNTLLKICDPELLYPNGSGIIGRIPSTFLAVYSGNDIYHSFRGASSNILML